MFKYLFSVVMPVYNVEDYLAESIDCIIGQTIGFKENIQLILINDGSPDNSDEICCKYKARYPDNIVYINQENSGVSVARNNGLDCVKGKYVNFLDSDDLWDLDAFEKIYNFFEENYDKTDVVTCSLKLFEAVEKEHPLNYRVREESRVADLRNEEEFDSIVLQVAPSFFKAESIKDVRFITGLKYGEDSMFVNSVIIKKMKVGFVNGVYYHYRKRLAGTSAVQSIENSYFYFVDRMRDYLFKLEELSVEKFGEVLSYFQNAVYYDFGYHLAAKVYDHLSEDEFEEFKELASELLNKIDDSVILNSRVHVSHFKKLAALRLKYKRDDITKDFTFERGEECNLCFNGIPFCELRRNRHLCFINFLKITGKKIKIEGLVERWVFDVGEKVKFLFKFNGEFAKVKLKDFRHNKYSTCFGEEERFYRFSVEYDLPESINEEEPFKCFPVFAFDKKKTRIGMNYRKFVANAGAMEPSYVFFGDYYVRSYRTVIKVFKVEERKEKIKKLIEMEKECQKWLKENGLKDIAKIRRDYFVYKTLHRNNEKIWLITDRVENAGDNGEVFFKYVSKQKREGKIPKNIRPIFAISKTAACVKRLKREGEVVFMEDKKFYRYFLLADKIISSGASDFTINPFRENGKYLIDLFNFKYYYLQHGVACADLSSWLNRYAKNIEKIFAVSEREKEGFLTADYYYGNKNVEVTGQARFDDLYDERKKQILILPTWRKSIKESYDINTTSIYFDGFKETEYFKYYNRLINDERLLNVMRENGYTGLFCVHPIHKEQTRDFEGNDVFKINEGYIDYNEVFAHSALMVTDYSSVLFDFAYLKKPVVYTQFDKKEFFEGQIYDEGYFSYEEDGFGPVCYDYESTVNALIAAVERDCENEEKYLKRVSDFFAFDDKNNSERIYGAIMSKSKKK